MTLLLLGLLSVGSIVFFRRLARWDAKRDLVSVEKYQFPDLFLIIVLGAFDIFLSYKQLTSPPEEVTSKLLVANAIVTLFLLMVVLGFLYVRWLNPLDLFGLCGKSPRTVLLTALFGWIAIVPLTFFFQVLTTHLSGPAPIQPLLIFLQTHDGWQDRLMLIFTAVILAPLSEEILFRGYMYGVIRRYAGRWCGILVSAAIFAAIHGHIPSLAGLFVLAVCLTLAYEYTGSLWTNMLIHAAFNSLSIVTAIWWPKLG